MTITSATHYPAASADTPALTDLVVAVRQVTGMRDDWARTADLVAGQLRTHLPGPGLLTPEQRRGHPDRPAGHLLHAEPDGTFSILGLVWRPGQSTRIHDHITWCVVGVLAGTEHEELFDESLNPVGVRDNHSGEVSGFAPPGDIHLIRNDGTETAISLHIYGTDITRIGSSARRYYN
ncbi:cysteine dioxygenase [Phytoactinopolyspora alkaliphila]|uniref:Cysteine dioxygenase n=1 Tax=Phytoactinopolyspora alkaliphila TaxID=1783498 RepID=A0A6N9YN27_9ACTN|nr:cysteine dioxygenase family protein [Phytoactinopolyspora alkaliphila]NED96393.1 cysteine dioxygenase [Phytoactinopolyspora alkaliphila]